MEIREAMSIARSTMRSLTPRVRIGACAFHASTTGYAAPTTWGEVRRKLTDNQGTKSNAPFPPVTE